MRYLLSFVLNSNTPRNRPIEFHMSRFHHHSILTKTFTHNNFCETSYMLITFLFSIFLRYHEYSSYICTITTTNYIIYFESHPSEMAQDAGVRRIDSDSDICINGDEDFGSTSSRHRNSVGRVSIRLVSDDRNIFLASYRNRD